MRSGIMCAWKTTRKYRLHEAHLSEALRRRAVNDKQLAAAQKAEALRDEITNTWPTTKNLFMTEVVLANESLEEAGLPERYSFGEYLVREIHDVAAGEFAIIHPINGELARLTFTCCSEFGTFSFIHHQHGSPTFRAKAIHFTVMNVTAEQTHELLGILFESIVPPNPEPESFEVWSAKRRRRLI
jgi:hypothetical protein